MSRLHLLILSLLLSAASMAEEFVCQIQEYDASAGAFVLKSFGRQPEGSFAEFWNDFGATTGNRYNQIPRNKEATLSLVGWEGCRIDSLVLSMCSNRTSGSARLIVTATGSAGDTTLFTMPTADFSSTEWYGEWLSKDVVVYADIHKTMTSAHVIRPDEDVDITIKGGTAEGSVYLYRVTVYYTPVLPIATESPLGYRYQKLEKKDVLHDLDTVLFFRSGDVASDLGGMETSHYLDALAIHSYNDVTEPDVLHFVLHRDSAETNHWQLVTLFGDTLCAAGLKHLSWGGGVPTWTITLGYSGAEVTSTHSGYGTICYNAPATSYPRFWNYASSSSSLPLPYLYRRMGQNQPTLPRSLELPSVRIVYLDQDTAVMHHSFGLSKPTDERLCWTSSDTTIATVRDGIVHLRALGEVTITASCHAAPEVAASCLLTITNRPSNPDDQDNPGDPDDTALEDVNAPFTATPVYDILGRQVPPGTPGLLITPASPTSKSIRL